MAITANGLIKLGFEPEVDFVVQDDGSGAYIKEWLSASPQPSDAAIEAADVEYQTAWDSQEYARDRAPEYPTIGDQLDMLWHAIDTGDWTAAKVKLTSFYTELKAVKDKYPKE
tara:strand:- start:147 stop:485 length:339 start_codon:yes stop_codon:yes gene_type:complete